MNKNVSLSVLLISIIFMMISIGPQVVFAEKDDDRDDEREGDGKHTEKNEHDLKDKIKEKLKDKLEKIKEKIKQKLKEKFEKLKDKKDKKNKSEERDDGDSKNNESYESDNIDDEQNPQSDYTSDESSFESETEDDEQVVISVGKRSPNDNAPFFGTDSFGNRYIDNGFTFNDFITDVEDFKTHMPLQTIQVGKSNTAVMKIYNHNGVSSLEHVELVFGIDKKDADEQNSIVWEQNFKGEQSFSSTDSTNLLMDVNAVGEADDKVMTITFTFAFREPLDKSKIGIVAWDKDRNSRTAIFNDGIQVVGESLNPPEIVTVLDDKGYPVKITMTGKNTGVDEEGNVWTHNSPWKKSESVENKLPQESPDQVDYHGFNRNSNQFASYKDIQAQEAQQKLMELFGGHNIYNFND